MRHGEGRGLAKLTSPLRMQAMVSPDKQREARKAEQSEEHAGTVRRTGPESAHRHGA